MRENQTPVEDDFLLCVTVVEALPLAALAGASGTRATLAVRQILPQAPRPREYTPTPVRQTHLDEKSGDCRLIYREFFGLYCALCL